ncbi:hypothetical protein [Microbulbifer epialgicus]|uniref:Uncharacterized protein n=1 Tax=Microbulbifer epialgicus TaxID=393907 RepID=A0ABV4P7Z9_9GAMM
MTLTNCPQAEVQVNIDSKIGELLTGGGEIKQIPRGQSGECLRVVPSTAGTTPRGRGEEWHGTGQSFGNQPMQRVSQLLDIDGGMAFQAIKKIHESRRLSNFKRCVAELLGAINYIAGMIIYEGSNREAHSG